MNIHYIVLTLNFIHGTTHLEISGELSFDVQILNSKWRADEGWNSSDRTGRDKDASEILGARSGSEQKTNWEENQRARQLDVGLANNRSVETVTSSVKGSVWSERVTVGAALECVYQYPDKSQMDALLSNMMNELTRIVVRAQDYTATANGDGRRGVDTRFRVVDKQDANMFEHAFTRMGEQYRDIFNLTIDRQERTARDPCDHQDEIKDIWEKTLQRAEDILRKAVLTSLREHLIQEEQRRELEPFLAHELGKVRLSQLDALCDGFQLCYNELL